MKALLSAALIALSSVSIAEPNKEGQDFYEYENTETASRFINKAEGWLNHNLMAKPQSARPAQTLSQVGSFSVHSNAEKHEARIKQNNSGSAVWIESVVFGNHQFYRVIIDRPCNSVVNPRPETGCAKAVEK